MKLFVKIWILSIPFAIGMAFSLLSVAAIVEGLENGSMSDNEIAAALVFAVIGFPLLVASTASILNSLTKHTIGMRPGA
jgi:hypothetical protein